MASTANVNYLLKEVHTIPEKTTYVLTPIHQCNDNAQEYLLVNLCHLSLVYAQSIVICSQRVVKIIRSHASANGGESMCWVHIFILWNFRWHKHSTSKMYNFFAVYSKFVKILEVLIVRVATAQGKQGIWFLLFPNRENTGNFAVT